MASSKVRRPHLCDALKWEQMVDELEVKSDNSVSSETLAANYRNYGQIMAFASNPNEGTKFGAEGSEYCCAAEADVFGHRDLACNHVAVFVEDLQ